MAAPWRRRLRTPSCPSAEGVPRNGGSPFKGERFRGKPAGRGVSNTSMLEDRALPEGKEGEQHSHVRGRTLFLTSEQDECLIRKGGGIKFLLRNCEFGRIYTLSMVRVLASSMPVLATATMVSPLCTRLKYFAMFVACDAAAWVASGWSAARMGCTPQVRAIL